MTQLEEREWFNDWYPVRTDCDRRGVEWTLYGFGEGPDLGKVEANGGLFFLGEFDRAAALWQAFAEQ